MKKRSLLNTLRIDERKEVAGVFLEIANTRVRLARAGGANQRFNAAMAKAHKEHGRSIDLGVIDNEKSLEILRRIWAETVVLTWETDMADEGAPAEWVSGIDDGDGGTLPVTVDNVVNFWRLAPDFFIECKRVSEESQLYRQNVNEAIAGN